jgi:hypothetical protein
VSLNRPCHAIPPCYMTTSTPTPEVRHPIQHRQNIARIVSSLRPVRPHTPFYRLAAHRVPTLWTLYRGLLRTSPSPIVCCNAVLDISSSVSLTSHAGAVACTGALPRTPSPDESRTHQDSAGEGAASAKEYYLILWLCCLLFRTIGQWLDAFRKAERGDERLRSVLQRFGRLIVARRDNTKMRSIVNDALVRPSPDPH